MSFWTLGAILSPWPLPRLLLFDVRERSRLVMLTVAAGIYTLVVSLFEPGWTGDFNLLLESSLPMTVSPIPQAGAGLFQRSLNGSWYAILLIQC